jgi:hypothetical protein
MEHAVNKTLISGLVGMALSISAVGTAAADATCEDVDIEITNLFVHNGDNKDIKVFDMEYWDAEDGKMRHEDISNVRIGHGDTHTYTRNLGKVGGESGVVIKVSFRYNLGGTAWSAPFVFFSQPFTCVDGMTVAFDIE